MKNTRHIRHVLPNVSAPSILQKFGREVAEKERTCARRQRRRIDEN